MDYPHGHVGHHRHHGRDDDENNSDNILHGHVKHERHHGRPDDDNNFPPPPSYGGDGVGYNSAPPPPQFDSYGGGYNSAPPPPPQFDSYGGGYNSAPPPPQQGSYGGGGYNSAPPPPQDYYGGGGYDAPPPAPPHFHSSPAQPPAYGGGGPTQSHHGFKPHMPSFHGSHSHHEPEYQGGGPEMGPGPGLGMLENKESSKIHCKAGGERFVFAIRDDKVVLTRPDSSDLTQQWYKDEKYSTKVKDKEGHPCFMLVNKGTAQAVKHSVSCHPVQLAPYRPDVLDEAVLWSESKDLGSGYRCIRTVNNIHLVMDAWNADKNHGGIHDGTVIALYETWKGDNQNQQWKFVRH